MKIENLKEFKALVKACRSLGIESVEADGVFVKLGPLTSKPRIRPAIESTLFPDTDVKVPAYDGPITEPEAVPTEGLTEEQMLMWSAQGHEQVEQ